MESQFIELPSGLGIHMLEAGTQGHPPVVLLHGWPASCRVWRNCMPHLAREYHVFAPDLPGHGQSGKPLDVRYDLGFLSTFLLDYLKTMALEKVHLVCHDLGALAGLGLVCDQPRYVASLVVMDTGPYPDWPIRAKLLIHIMKNRWLTHLLLNRFVFTQLFRHRVFFDPALATPERIALFRDPWIEDQSGRKAFRHTIDVPPAQLALPLEKLRHIRAPVLILWAQNDDIFPVTIARQLQQDIPDARLRIVPDAGHFLQEEKPDAVVDNIREFLAQSNRWERQSGAASMDNPCIGQISGGYGSASG